MMERLVKTAKVLRSNWKKSTLGFIALSYAASKVKENVEINALMTAMCKEAALYGDGLCTDRFDVRKVTVILNPAANDRSAKAQFEKYCEPLLHLAGVHTTIIQTTSEGHAKDIIETLQGTEAIIVAGGDGTLSETVTGIFRRGGEACKLPIGVIPLGRNNDFANRLFPGGKGVQKVKQLTDATMAIIKDKTKLQDVMKIQPMEEDEAPVKPIFAMGSLQWGAFRDAYARRDKYWFWGPLRNYACFVFNGYKSSLAWICSGTLKYSPPCPGCSNCVQRLPEPKKKWTQLFLSKNNVSKNDGTFDVENESCKMIEEQCFKTSEVTLKTAIMEDSPEQSLPSLKLYLGKNQYNYIDFVSEGWNRVNKGEPTHTDIVTARTIEVIPKEESNEKLRYAIDNEEFEIRPIKVTLLPKAIKVYSNAQ